MNEIIIEKIPDYVKAYFKDEPEKYTLGINAQQAVGELIMSQKEKLDVTFLYKGWKYI